MSNRQDLRLLNTRSMHQAAPLDDLLLGLGITPVSFPCVTILPSADQTQLLSAMSSLEKGEFDWLILTSQNAVDAVANIVGPITIPSQFKTATVGPATANAATCKLGLTPHFIPGTYTSQTLAEMLPLEHGDRVLIPQSAIAPADLAESLTHRGAEVTTVPAYRTTVGTGGVDLASGLNRHEFDGVIFASSSAVTGFVERLHSSSVGLSEALTLPAICIGNRTAESARRAGFAHVHVAGEQSLQGLSAAIESVFGEMSVRSPR